MTMIALINQQPYFSVITLCILSTLVFIFQSLLIDVITQLIYEVMKTMFFMLFLIIALGSKVQRIKLYSDEGNIFVYPLSFRIEPGSRPGARATPVIAEPPPNPWTVRTWGDQPERRDQTERRAWGDTN